MVLIVGTPSLGYLNYRSMEETRWLLYLTRNDLEITGTAELQEIYLRPDGKVVLKPSR